MTNTPAGMHDVQFFSPAGDSSHAQNIANGPWMIHGSQWYGCSDRWRCLWNVLSGGYSEATQATIATGDSGSVAG